MGYLGGSGRHFQTIMVFLFLAIFVILALAIGYDKGWGTVIDSWGMDLDVLFVSIFLLFSITGVFVVMVLRR